MLAVPITETEWQELVRAALQSLRKGPLARIWSGLRKFAVVEELSLVERRRLERVECKYELRLHTRSGKLKVRTVDVSLSGVGVRTARPLRRGERVQLEAPLAFWGAPMPAARVCYSRKLTNGGFHTGLELEVPSVAPSWVPQALLESGVNPGHFRQRREHVRARGPLLARAQNSHGETLYCTVLDLSRGGAMLRTGGHWTEGDPVSLLAGPLGDLPPLPLEGLVVRTRPHKKHGESLVSVRFRGGSALLDLYLRALLRG